MRKIPTVPLLLGLAGLIPFWALAVTLYVPILPAPPDLIERALAAYAAIIISFLGGIRWGLAASSDRSAEAHYAVSVLPSLAAWALLAAPEPWRLSAMGVLAIALGPIDYRLVEAGLAPVWLGRLRLLLSSLAGIALLIGAWGSARV